MDDVDLDDLTDAFEDASLVMPYYLDRETGEILLVSDALGFIDAERKRLEMARQRNRYIAIPPLSFAWREEVMEAFIGQVSDERLAGHLESVLDLPEPGKAWNSIIGDDVQWLAFLRIQARAHAAAWLSKVKINT